MISKTGNTEEIARLAMSDDLFMPESISLEPGGKSLTVRLPEQFNHFSRKSLITIPAFNEDLEYEKEFPLL
jgi:hypothetical protein